MKDNQDIKSEKYLNLPILTPEEEAAIEEREARKVAERQMLSAVKKDTEPKDIQTAAAAVLGGTVPEENKNDAGSAKDSEAAEPLFTEVLSPDELKEHLAKLDEESLSSIASATDLFKTCVLPNNTELQERILKTKSDILVGDHCRIEYGLSGADIAVCECTQLYGDIVAAGDLRIDNFCEVFGTVICNGDAFIGEGVKIHGKMTIGGNLDIAENVLVDQEFQTFGNIAIRNPVPVIIYLLIYVLAMLHISGEKATEKKLNAFMNDVKSVPLVLPPNTTMNLTYFTVQTPMDIGANCRIHGNVHAQSIKIKKDTTLFGSISVTDKAKIGVRDAIHGDVSAKTIRIDRGADVLGDLVGGTVWLHEDAHVSGIIKAEDGLSIGFGG
ncbi:MAG TPA: acyltransferase [Methanocorpusculum sp.]|nr:acyltransferase [Methanocorpusculum sp.]